MLKRFKSSFHVVVLLAISLIIAGFAAPLEAADNDSSLTFIEALKEGKFGLDLRYRFEQVDDDLFDDDGKASTLRTVLNYKSAAWKKTALFIEMEDITNIGFSDSHNDAGRDGTGNGVSDRPVIADPPDTDVNQAYLDFGFIPESSLKLGRQEINLGNQRFVGAVAWRQNHQSFDSASLTTKAIPKTLLTYAYVGEVQRILGDSMDMSSHLLEADIKMGKVGTLRAYGFFLDYQEEVLYGLSTSTFGLRFDGSHAFNSRFKGLWDLEYAQQQDFGDNTNNVDAGYLRIELGAKAGSWTFKIGQEVLEGGPENGKFTTPLATLHKWNGWADQFLATPANGLEDTYLLATTKLGSVNLTGVYHQFEANTGGADYGSEFDFHAVYVTSWKQKVGLKFAAYDAKEHSRDVTKIWLWTAWGF